MRIPGRSSVIILASQIALVVLSACGGTGHLILGPSGSYTIGGTVSGLSGPGLVLVDNGQDNLAVSANGAFTFPTPVQADDSAYVVAVFALPSSPLQSCVVSSGSGVALANVTGVQVTCTTIAAPAAAPIDTAANQWTWAGGSDLPGQPGVYGLLGSGAPDTVPGARQGAVRWTDASGNFWLFGGSMVVGSRCALTHALCWLVSAYANDLWKYADGEWTWEGGSDESNQPGVYGTQGTSAPGNVPGARAGAVSWTDASGNLWLFGGNAANLDNAGGTFNDLWKYSEGQWAWVSGSKLSNQPGVYGTLRQPAPGNTPGARSQAVSWSDAAGNLWLFGGNGYDSTGSSGPLNDLWTFSNGQWTWMSGSNLVAQLGVYGTMGKAAPANVPGAREHATGWTDASGNLWLFGGYGAPGANGGFGKLNDLWKYSDGQWTWVSGTNLTFQPGVYGSEGTAAAGNMPGAREGAMNWTDAAGNLWLFGGMAIDATGAEGELNDLWKFSAGQWTWESGSNIVNQAGTYGILGTPAAANVPGARDTAVTWIDASGKLWLLGGNTSTATVTTEQLNDLWVYQP